MLKHPQPQMKSSVSKLGALATTLLFLSFATSAQITINTIHLPQAGSTYTIQESTPDPLVDYSNTGAGVIWDFSGLESINELDIAFGDIESAPTLAQLVFNQAWMQPDHVSDIYGPGELPDMSEFGSELPIEVSSFYNYYQTSGDNYNIAGFSMGAQGIDFPVPYTDIDEIHPLPLSYGDNVNSTHAFVAEIPTMFSYASEGSRVGVVDGWGTLLLPNGQEHEVLRLATIINKSDEFTLDGMNPIPFEYETTVYQWLGDGGLPYLEVQAAFNAPFRVRYQGEVEEEDTSGTEGITGVIQEDIKMFPNPANIGETITLQGVDANSTWEVRNGAGVLCKTGQGSLLDTGNLSAGAYFLIQNTSNNGLVSIPKVLIVQ